MKHGLSEETYNKIKKVVQKNNKYRFLIFGSRARGDYKKTSDIDLAIEGNITEEEKHKIMNEIDEIDIIYKIDIIFIDETTKKELRESIKRDGVEF